MPQRGIPSTKGVLGHFLRLPPGAPPYSEAEVRELRSHRPSDVARERAGVVEALRRMGQVVE